MELGIKLKMKRESLRLSQQEVADYLNISQKTYSNMESNKTFPSLTQLAKIGDLLDLDFLEIIKDLGIKINQQQNEFKDNSTGFSISSFPKNLIKQYENQLSNKDEIIVLPKETIADLRNNKSS